jgi:hypothetical protein
MLLVSVARAADTAFQADAAALLHHVRGLMRGSVQIWR